MKVISRRVLIGFAVAIFLATGNLHGSPAPATAPISMDAVASLRSTALGDDLEKSITALRQLSAAGSRGGQSLSEVARQLLARDSATIESETSVLTGQLSKLRPAETELQALRAQALAAIDGLTLDPESLKAARRNYARLSNTQARLTPIYSRQMRVIEAFSRRTECFSLLPSGKPPADAARLAKLAEQALAMSPDAAQKFLSGPLDPPADPNSRQLWLYVASRRIDAWNRLAEPAINAAEAAHLRRVNFYRELLGLLPFELDARLVQSARRHSKEMMELWYFSHYSPTEAERSPFDRMAHAGYRDGSNENITMGSWSGEDAFQQFFASPDHHRAWVSRDDTAIGVGKWENAWTEDIGAGPRLMTASADERAAAAVVRGAELKPQLIEQTRQHPRDLATIKFYDESGQEVKQPPGVEKKVSSREQ